MKPITAYIVAKKNRSRINILEQIVEEVENPPEGQPGSSTASNVSIADVDARFTSDNVEGALQEVGQALNSMRGNLITSINNVLGG